MKHTLCLAWLIESRKGKASKDDLLREAHEALARYRERFADAPQAIYLSEQNKSITEGAKSLYGVPVGFLSDLPKRMMLLCNGKYT